MLNNPSLSIPLLAVLIISLLILFIFTSLERAFRYYSKIRYEVDKKQEKRYALIMEELLESESEVLISLKIASTLFVVLYAVACALLFNNFLTGLIIALLSILILTKLVPAAVASAYPHFILNSFINFAKIAFKLFSPFVAKKSEVFHPAEKEESSEITILQNALNFSEVKIRECMIPRTEICAVNKDASNDELLKLFAESKFSRILVYDGNIDKIIGYVHSKDLFIGNKTLDSMIREIDYVSEEMEAQELLSLLIKTKSSIAVVNDEYGGTAGVVTLEDLIEEIFGEISDELDGDELPEKKIAHNRFIFSGRLEIKYLNKTYDLDIPENDDYETLGGFITWFHENIPAEGDLLKYENFEFSILKTVSNRVESVILKVVE